MNYVKNKIIHLISFNLSPNNYATSRGIILADVFKTDLFALHNKKSDWPTTPSLRRKE
tara:strand:- start:199 stop:372 length:174 start_codon:yes stop_codon:yes gene_type:complete